VWHVSDIHGLNRMRWYLKEGWGAAPHYGTGDVVLRAERGDILLPCLRPRPLALVLAADAAREELVEVLVNDRPVGQALVGPEGRPAALRVPASVLVRGDNVLTLAAPQAGTVRLRTLSFARLDGQGASAPRAK
jgi:hypothetical protein